MKYLKEVFIIKVTTNQVEAASLRLTIYQLQIIAASQAWEIPPTSL